MRRSRTLLLTGGAVCAACVAACVALTLLVPPGTPGTLRGRAAAQPEPGPGLESGPEAAPVARRLPVAGATGYFVVVEPDGASYMEGPDGRRVPLAAAEPPPRTPPAPQVQQVPVSVPAPTRMVVCDTGVVSIAADAIVTFVGRDRVVTLGADASSTVYYTDGRVERRDRVSRRGSGAAAGRNP